MTKNQSIDTKISPDILDTIGRAFKFRHSKGIAEWLKNSLDNYLRRRQDNIEPLDGSWPILLSLYDTKSPSSGPNLAVIDFGGTSFRAVDDFFLYWGSNSAARHGKDVSVDVTGGHGNGGKFYMREMWKSGARFSTFFNGRVTSLVVSKAADGGTGYWELQDESMGWREAMQRATPETEGMLGGSDIIQHLELELPEIVADLDSGKRGFTALVGRRAEQLKSASDVVKGGSWDSQRLVDAVRDEPQARRPLRELNISVLSNGALVVRRLKLATIEEDPDWDTKVIDIPIGVLPLEDWRQGFDRAGTLKVQKSIQPLTGRYKDLNSLSIADDRGNPIARYLLTELAMPGTSTSLTFFGAEMSLEFGNVKELVANDREQLLPSETTSALLSWSAEAIWGYLREFDAQQKSAQRNQDLMRASVLNDALNDHAKRFLEELQSEIMVDFVDTESGGGAGKEGSGTGGSGQGSGGNNERKEGKGGSTGEGGTEAIPGSQTTRKVPKFPSILLSDIDEDPADPGHTKSFTDRHPPLEQDDLDKIHNVWWINTRHPFAAEALRHGGPEGSAFKSHQLFMFRDVVQHEALRYLQRREAELGLDRIEIELTETSNRFLSELPVVLLEQLLQ